MKEDNKNHKNGLRVVMILVAGAIVFGIITRVIWLATPYNSRLAWKIDEWLHNKDIAYTHNNIYTDGVEGILTDIKEQIEMPEELYISGAQTIDYSLDGTVTDISMFLYGTNDKGDLRTYLIVYNASDEVRSKSAVSSTSMENGASTSTDNSGTTSTEQLLVITDGELGTDTTQNAYRDTMLLSPMIALSEAIDLKTISESYAEDTGAASLQLLYWGYRAMTGNNRTHVVTDPDAPYSANSDYARLLNESLYLGGNDYEGYEISIHAPALADATPERYFAGWLTADDYVTPEEEFTAEITDDESLGTGFMSDDGNMYCYISANVGYRLNVIDAAAGSRVYTLEKTTDGGTSWILQNEDPYLGAWGVAMSMTFTDEEHGEIQLAYGSGEWKRTCRTEDGGVTFTLY